MKGDFTTIRTVGGTLPPDLLERLVAGDASLGGLDAESFHLLPSETPRNAAHRAWSYLKEAWTSFAPEIRQLPEKDPAVGFTRDRWLHVLLGQLGFGRVPQSPAGGLVVDEHAYAVSHLWQHVPIHLLGWNVPLDRRTKGVPGAAERAPHALMQELLNRTDQHLWAIVSNGRTLRLLRDSTNLTGLAYVEFDLETMFDGDVFSDFVVLYLLLHESRFEAGVEASPAQCWLEKWRAVARDTGVRALQELKFGVQEAITALGTGFVQHPANGELRRRLAAREMSVEELHRELLRLVYRLLFLFVAEDRPERDLLLDPEVTATQRQRWLDFYSTQQLRRRARTIRRTSHADEWHRIWTVVHRLGTDGVPELGLPPLLGLFAPTPGEFVASPHVIEVGAGAARPANEITNDHLLTAIRALSVIRPRGQQERVVDFGRLGAEELGGIYESLLELVPRLDLDARTFALEELAGNDRKTTGSYYTPSDLIDLVLDEALDPLLDEAMKASDPEAALLAMTICDPACGSGHFLVAAARRVAERLATVRAQGEDLTPSDFDTAMRDVIVRCMHGVDIQPMAAELAKVSLWLESMERGRPLAFLDHHIKVGNSLLGATPALISRGVPNEAYAVLTGDDKEVTKALRKRKRRRAKGHRHAFRRRPVRRSRADSPEAAHGSAGQRAAANPRRGRGHRGEVSGARALPGDGEAAARGGHVVCGLRRAEDRSGDGHHYGDGAGSMWGNRRLYHGCRRGGRSGLRVLPLAPRVPRGLRADIRQRDHGGRPHRLGRRLHGPTRQSTLGVHPGVREGVFRIARCCHCQRAQHRASEGAHCRTKRA